MYCNVRFLEATAFAVFLELFQARYPPKVLDLVCDTKSHYNVALIAFHALEHFDHISKNPAWRAKNQDARSSPSLWVKSASFAQTPFAVFRMDSNELAVIDGSMELDIFRFLMKETDTGPEGQQVPVRGGFN